MSRTFVNGTSPSFMSIEIRVYLCFILICLYFLPSLNSFCTLSIDWSYMSDGCRDSVKLKLSPLKYCHGNCVNWVKMWFCGWNGHPSMFVCVVLTSSFVLVCVLFPCWSIFFSHVNIFKTKTFILIWNILLKRKVMIQNALIKKIMKEMLQF